jgi:hypothetical protein
MTRLLSLINLFCYRTNLFYMILTLIGAINYRRKVNITIYCRRFVNCFISQNNYHERFSFFFAICLSENSTYIYKSQHYGIFYSLSGFQIHNFTRSRFAHEQNWSLKGLYKSMVFINFTKEKGQTTIYKTLPTNPTKNRGWTRVYWKGKQFQLHLWHLLCYSCYKPGYKSWIRKGPSYMFLLS